KEGLFLDVEALKSGILSRLHLFIAGFQLTIQELVQFANELLDDEERDVISPHVQKFLNLKRDINFLKNFILQPEIYNNFMHLHSEHFYDPKSFAKQMSAFASDGAEKLPIEWTVLMENWFSTFSNVFQIKHAQQSMSRPEIIARYFDFIKIIADEQDNFENTFTIISSYAGSLKDSREKRILLEFLKRFEQSQDIQEKFPGYFEKKIQEAMDELDIGNLLQINVNDPAFKDKLIKKTIGDTLNPLSQSLVFPSELAWRKGEGEFKFLFKVEDGILKVDLTTNWFNFSGGI
ncbi:MAG: hypothetical protein ACTSUE_21140, partial [Promethearchaeota archaeon]